MISCDPGTVNTKMLLAGWGYCGIEVEDANDEFDLATRDESQLQHGKYYVGGRVSSCSKDVYNEESRKALWSYLEDISGLSVPC